MSSLRLSFEKLRDISRHRHESVFCHPPFGEKGNGPILVKHEDGSVPEGVKGCTI